MATTQYVFLVPGFFGFANVGRLHYFGHVARVLAPLLEARGLAAEVVPVPTLPTASLRRRAAVLARHVTERAPADADVHLIGHSSGGLDARLLTAPGVELPGIPDPAIVADRVRSVTTLASPHCGTPLATFFQDLAGQQLLRLLSIVTTHLVRLDSMPLRALPPLVRVLSRPASADPGALNQIYQEVLADFSPERREQIRAFFDEVKSDQALLPELTYEAMRSFNHRVTRRPSTRYGCVACWARPPSLGRNVSVGLTPAGQATYALYRTLYRLAAGSLRLSRGLEWQEKQRKAVRASGFDPTRFEANDAIVPTLSQVHGDVIDVVRADHLDVIGWFKGPETRPPHVDWLRTLSGFDRPAFERLWSRIADYIAGSLAGAVAGAPD